MGYCDVRDVLEIIPNRNIDNETSVIKTADVSNFISHCDNIINLYLKEQGLDDSVSNYTNELKTIEALMVAGMIEARLKADDGGEDDELPNNALYKEGIALLQKLSGNNIIQPITDPEDTADGLLDSDDEFEPTFYRNKRQW